MGIFARTRDLFGAAETLGLGGSFGVPTSIVSPWQDGSLAPFVWSDIFGVEMAPVTRLEALRVPAVSKARAVLHALLGAAPLRAYDSEGQLADQPTWLYRSDTGISPRQRTLAMLDDHFFNDATLLAVTRGSKRQILDAVRVPFDRWEIDSEGRIVVDGIIADSEEVVWIPGPGPGLLLQAAETIRGARNMERSWAGRVRNPTPTMILKQKQEGSLTGPEVQEYLTAIRAARQDPDGTVAFIPAEIDLELSTGSTLDLFDSGRNAARVDIANHTNLPASLLDGSLSTASLTYSTAEGKRNEVSDYSLPYWTGPIESGLSEDNVTPRGTHIKFDFSALLTSTADPDAPSLED